MAAQPNSIHPSPESISRAWRMIKLIDGYYIEAANRVPEAKVADIARQWISKARLGVDETEAELIMVETYAFAVNLAIFTPSLTGVSLIDRLARQHPSSVSSEDRLALTALSGSKFHALKLLARQTQDLVLAEDVTSGALVALVDRELPAAAMGVKMASRLCGLPDNLFGLVGPNAPLDPSALDIVLSFARPGKGLNNSLRCAAALYKHLVRNGGPRINGINAAPRFDDAADIMEGKEDCDLDRIAKAWALLAEGEEPTAASLAEARRLTSSPHIILAIGSCLAARARGEIPRAEAYSRLAYVQMETMHRRAIAGTGRDQTPLQAARNAIARAVAEAVLPRGARELFEDLHRRLLAASLGAAKTGAANPGAANPGAGGDELARVLKLIQALRAKTVDQGCTEQEAMASAGKVAELLDRYGLSLSEVEMRQQVCEGVGIETGRRRRGPLDTCIPSIAMFCDCKAWSEKSASGAIRYVFFGLPADVEAAHYLHDLIKAAFDVETDRFKRGAALDAGDAGERRSSVNSFQVGLGDGICRKLMSLKSRRDEANSRSSGRDLVTVKASVIEDELEKLGLAFVSKGQRRKQRVVADAYEAGREAGGKFELRAGLATSASRAV